MFVSEEVWAWGPVRVFCGGMRLTWHEESKLLRSTHIFAINSKNRRIVVEWRHHHSKCALSAVRKFDAFASLDTCFDLLLPMCCSCIELWKKYFDFRWFQYLSRCPSLQPVCRLVSWLTCATRNLVSITVFDYRLEHLTSDGSFTFRFARETS